MPRGRKLPSQTIDMIAHLQQQGVPLRRAERQSGIPFSTLQNYYQPQDHTSRLLKNAKRAGYTSHYDRKKQTCAKGPESLSEINKRLAKARQERVENIIFATYVGTNLERLNQDARWLARQLGVTKYAVEHYLKANTLPNETRCLQIFQIFERTEMPQFRTIDEYVAHVAETYLI